ncbi:MAG: AAA family ATPase [Candidatus Ornithospirochaeta sp.]
MDDFEKLIKWRFFYVDKTLMIKDLLSSCSKVNLFTRPRRFGKSLNLSMLFQFFDIDSDKSVFVGLNILSQKELVSENMGKYPVILKLL